MLFVPIGDMVDTKSSVDCNPERSTNSVRVQVGLGKSIFIRGCVHWETSSLSLPMVSFDTKVSVLLLALKSTAVYKKLVGSPKIHYVIYSSSGGMNSILARVLGHLKIAETNGWIPFVDMERNSNYYSELEQIHGSRNVWEYYFQPVSSVSPAAVYAGGDWLDSAGRFPHEVMTPLFSDVQWIPEVWKKHIRLRPETHSAIDESEKNVYIGPEVLGIHFRGTDMRTFPGHPMPPTEKQMFRRVDAHLNDGSFTKLFLVTEAESYVQLFANRYGKRLSYLDVARQGKEDIFRSRPRKNHRYLLGLENIVETHLLSRCGGLVSGYSGMSEMAQVLSRDLKTVDKIWNGRVPPRPKFVANRVWSYRASVPRILGGFKR